VSRFVLAALAVSLALGGCDWFTSNNYRDRLSIVTSVAAPDTVSIGSSFSVVIETQGPDGCWRKGHDLVFPSPLLVQIRAVDQEYVGAGACASVILDFTHQVVVRAPSRGTMKVEVLHRLTAVSGEDSVGVIERLVVVR